MKLYIDIEHFEALALSASHPQFPTCMQMLLNDCDLKLTFPKEKLRNIGKKKSRDAVNMFITRFQTGKKNAPVAEKEPLPTLTGSASDYEHLTSLYFVNSPEVKKGLINPQAGDEIKALTSLFVDERYIPTKQYFTPDFTDWSVVEKDSSICTDIIIVDQFLFAQSDIHYQENAYNLINSLCKKSVGADLNIVIFTRRQYKDEQKNSCVIPDATITRNIKGQVAAITGVEPNVTLVYISTVEKRHDRKIFTNYKTFNSGDTFTYFKNNSFNSDGEDFYSNSHVDRSNCRNTERSIQILQEIVKNVANGVYSIIGDKKSNFLQFP